jgi:hypothetical protein
MMTKVALLRVAVLAVLAAYSSAPLFDGFIRSVPVDWLPPSPGPPPRAAPETWLLRAAWRRFGLLDPQELVS